MRDVDRKAAPAARPTPRVPPTASRAHRPFVGEPHGTRDVLALQRMAGNDAVRQLLAPAVQRCGDHVEAGCPCADGHDADGHDAGAAPGVQRQPTGAPACNPPGTRRVPGSDADSVDAALKDDCLPEAYAILNGHAMYGLLPILQALHPRPAYAKLRASAGGMGGPRMETSIAVVDLKLRGTPITGADVRGLIDRMAELPADQRRDILRYIGKLVVIDVQGFPVDFSYCKSSTGKGCADGIKETIEFNRQIIEEYAACQGDKRLRNGSDVKRHVNARMQARGWKTEVAGTTSPTGQVTAKAQPLTQCEPIDTYATVAIHEGVHANTQQHMVKKYGPPTSAAFDAAWMDRDNWAADEVKAHTAERGFYIAVLKAITTLEGKL